MARALVTGWPGFSYGEATASTAPAMDAAATVMDLR